MKARDIAPVFEVGDLRETTPEPRCRCFSLNVLASLFTTKGLWKLSCPMTEQPYRSSSQSIPLMLSS